MSLAANGARILPDWLKSNGTKDCYVSLEKLEFGEDNIATLKNEENQDSNGNSVQSDLPPAKRYRTRSSISNEVGTNAAPIKKKGTAPPRPKPAFIEYNGKVDYYTEFFDIAMASDNLLSWVNKQETTEMIPIAFDMEWPFTFQTGPGRTAVVQLCADVDLCYVFHIAELKKLPTALVQLLTHDKVLLHGVNIKNEKRDE